MTCLSGVGDDIHTKYSFIIGPLLLTQISTPLYVDTCMYTYIRDFRTENKRRQGRNIKIKFLRVYDEEKQRAPGRQKVTAFFPKNARMLNKHRPLPYQKLRRGKTLTGNVLWSQNVQFLRQHPRTPAGKIKFGETYKPAAVGRETEST